MENFTVGKLIKTLGGDMSLYDKALLEKEIKNISTDSRSITDNEVFFAIRGEKFDGAEYIDDTFRAGGILAVVNSVSAEKKTFIGPVVKVDDTILALGAAASGYRDMFNIKVIAVTGTSGKTTVKEMIMGVLSTKWNVHGTKGNLNNHIGLPMTVFGLERKHDIAVFELGMSAPGEIEYLSKIAKPDIGIVLNIGHGHIKYFNSLEEIAECKMELIGALDEDGVAIINGDDELLKLSPFCKVKKVLTFGVKGEFDFKAYNIETGSDGCASFMIDGRKVKLGVPGVHNVYNALAAYAAGAICDVDPDAAIESIQKFQAPKLRMQSMMKNGIHFINDSYNANPLSMKAAADALKHIKEVRKIVVLGDMLELGDLSESLHLEVGEAFAKSGADMLCLFGSYADSYYNGALKGGMDGDSIIIFDNIDNISDFLKITVKSGDLVFVKGSRAVGMEKIINNMNGNV